MTCADLEKYWSPAQDFGTHYHHPSPPPTRYIRHNNTLVPIEPRTNRYRLRAVPTIVKVTRSLKHSHLPSPWPWGTDTTLSPPLSCCLFTFIPLYSFYPANFQQKNYYVIRKQVLLLSFKTHTQMDRKKNTNKHNFQSNWHYTPHATPSPPRRLIAFISLL